MTPASRAGPRRAGEDGVTLIEMLLTVAIMGIAFTVILGGLVTSITASDVHRKQATAETLVRAAAEAVKAAPYEGCVRVTGATNTAPVVLSVPGHPFVAGDTIFVRDVGGNAAANGKWTVESTTADTVTLAGSTGSGPYTSGGSALRLPVLTLPATAPNFTAGFTGVGYWDPAAPRAPFGRCPATGDAGLQRFTVEVASTDGRISEALEVVRRNGS